MLQAETTEHWVRVACDTVRERRHTLTVGQRRAMVGHARDARRHVAEAKEAAAERELRLQAGAALRRNPAGVGFGGVSSRPGWGRALRCSVARELLL